MVKINPYYECLGAGYLFPEIAKRTKAFQDSHPEAKIMKLGIGNTTEPLTPAVVEGLKKGVNLLASPDGYSGYGDEQGNKELREVIVNQYAQKGIKLESTEIFISDGAKPDTANIQSIFAQDSTVAVQDPSYPVYVDTNVISGRAGSFDKEKKQYTKLIYMSCNKENGFFPDLPDKKVDLIYLCSPNNPTGAVATKEQLKKFVDFARENKSLIIFDAAYSSFISDPQLPKSIYEIEGAKECAIEVNSLSKSHGFTGVRLGWTIVPHEIVVEGTAPGKINSLWKRRQCTFFNGASNIVQQGALTALGPRGIQESQGLVDYYMENAKMIKKGLKDKGLTVYGGVNAPYIWVETPNGMNSWDFFDKLLNETHVVVTPGSGFGPSGEGYFRLSAFGHREDVKEAVDSIKRNLKI